MRTSFHLMAYTKASGVSDVNVDMTAVSDTVFNINNSHFVFSDQIDMLAAIGQGGTLTDLRMSVPSWNGTGFHHVYPLEVSATPQSYPRVADYRKKPLQFPTSEEIALQESTSSATATAQIDAFLCVTPRNQIQYTYSDGGPRIVSKATGTITTVANAWSGLNAITFSEPLRGGWYAVNWVWVVATASIAFRCNFPRSNFMPSRGPLRPGWLVNHAASDLDEPRFVCNMGEWGRHTATEPFTLELFDGSAASRSVTIFIDQTYLGDGTLNPNMEALPQ